MDEVTAEEVVHLDLKVPEALYQKVIAKVTQLGGFELVFQRFLDNLLTDTASAHSRDPKLCGHPDTFESTSGARLCPWCKSVVAK